MVQFGSILSSPRLFLGVCCCLLPCVDVAGVRLWLWWCCSFRWDVCWMRAWGWHRGALLQVFAQSCGHSRKGVPGPGWCSHSCVSVSLLDAEGAMGGGQSSSSAAPVHALWWHGRHPDPLALRSIPSPWTWPPLPAVIPLGVGIARALPVPIINPACGWGLSQLPALEFCPTVPIPGHGWAPRAMG